MKNIVCGLKVPIVPTILTLFSYNLVDKFIAVQFFLAVRRMVYNVQEWAYLNQQKLLLDRPVSQGEKGWPLD